AHGNLGFAWQTLGQLDRAIDCYQKAVAIAPNDASLHNNLGNAFDEAGRVDKAVASYRRALQYSDAAEIRANFARCVKKFDARQSDADLRRLVTRAISEAWTRPDDL